MHQSAMYLTMHAMIFTTEQLRQAPERILQITDLILKNFNMEIHRLGKKSILYVRQKQFFFSSSKINTCIHVYQSESINVSK